MTVSLLIPVTLNGTSAIVTDPCYYGGSEYMHHEVKDLQQYRGSWMLETHREEMGGWGERTVELTVVHSTFSPSDARILSHSAGVDSGQMSICGDRDAERFANPDDYGPNGFEPLAHAGKFDYQGACDITLNHPTHSGVLCGVMAVSDTGCGDGVYPVYVWRNAAGMATKISVDFRDDPEEDEYDEIEEEEVDDD